MSHHEGDSAKKINSKFRYPSPQVPQLLKFWIMLLRCLYMKSFLKETEILNGYRTKTTKNDLIKGLNKTLKFNHF